MRKCCCYCCSSARFLRRRHRESAMVDIELPVKSLQRQLMWGLSFLLRFDDFDVDVDVDVDDFDDDDFDDDDVNDDGVNDVCLCVPVDDLDADVDAPRIPLTYSPISKRNQNC